MKIFQMVSVFLPLLLSLVLLYRALDYFVRYLDIFHMHSRHGYYSLLALFSMTLAVCLFRVLPGLDTRPIIYMHGFLHISAIYIIYYSMYNEESIEWPYLHGFPAWITFYCYAAQIIFGLITYFVVPDGAVRDLLDKLHTIVGVWLYQCYIGVAITGWHNCSPLPNTSGKEEHGCMPYLDYYKSLLIMSSVIVNFILIFPCFQWDVVGNL